jgi:hypothetical protein
MRKLVLFVAAVGVTCHFIGAANAKDHLQQISKDSAAALCKGYGGGTECDFCQGNLCHTVICGTRSCGNLVTTTGINLPNKNRPVAVGVIKQQPISSGATVYSRTVSGSSEHGGSEHMGGSGHK